MLSKFVDDTVLSQQVEGDDPSLLLSPGETQGWAQF